MKTLKKSLAIIISMLLLMTAVFIPGMLTASAAEADPKASLIYGKLPGSGSLRNYSGWGAAVPNFGGTYGYGAITDGNAASGSHVDYSGCDGNFFVWNLDRPYDFTSFAFWNYTDKNREISYEIYIADEFSEAAVNPDNLVYTHTADGITASPYQEGELSVTGAVVILKITKSSANYSGDSARIREFAIYGTPSENAGDKTYFDNLLMHDSVCDGTDAESLIADTEPYAASEGGATNWKTLMTDGSFSTDYIISYGDIYGTLGVPKQITYKLDTVYDITGVSIFNGVAANKIDYAVYIGSDIDTLYSAENLYYSYSHDGTYGAYSTGFGTNVKFNAAKELPSGIYVGFQLTSQSDGIARIGELQVFGKKSVKGAIVERESTAADFTTDSVIYGKTHMMAWDDENLIYDPDGNNYDLLKTHAFNAYQSGLPKLTDGTTSTAHADVFIYYSKLVWELDKTTEISAFGIMNRTNYTQSTAYKVYMSENLQDLFDESNEVYYFDYLDVADGAERTYDTTSTPIPTNTMNADKLAQHGQYVEFYGDYKRDANYVGVLLMDTETSTTVTANTGSAKNGRISEIAFFGTPSENNTVSGDKLVASATQNYSIATDVNAKYTHANNLLNYNNLSIKNASGAAVAKGTADEKYTDGVVNVERQTGNNGYKYTYALGTITEIDALGIWDNTPNRDLDYKVYVSYSASSLYDPANLVFYWEGDIYAAAKTRVYEFANKPVGMFVGIEIAGYSVDNFDRTTEWAVWGTKEDLGYSISTSVSVGSDVDALGLSTYKNVAKNAKYICTMQGVNHDRIVDGNAAANTYADVYGGQYDHNDIIIDLGTQVKADAIAVWTNHYERKFGYKLRVSETRDGLTESAPVFEWKYSYDTTSNGQMIKFDELKTFRFVSFTVTDTSIAGDSIRLGEIAVFGEAAPTAADFVELEKATLETKETPDVIRYSAVYKFPADNLGLTVTEFGSVIFPTTKLGENELTLETEGAVSAVSSAENIELVNGYDEDGYTAIRVSSTFKGASKIAATLKLTARAYVKLSDGSVWYSEPISRSVTQIKRTMAKEYMAVYKNDTDAITNKDYNGAIASVWAQAMTDYNNVKTAKGNAVNGAAQWLNTTMTETGVTAEMLDNGLISSGDTARIANVIRKLMRGEDITLVQLGGSITEGYRATADNLSQGAQVYNFLNAAFPGQVTFVNAGIAATTSVTGAHRLNADVMAYNPDLVIVEYNINDGLNSGSGMAGYENIIRQLLSQDVATIALTNMVHSNSEGGASGSAATMLAIAEYYNVPRVDATSAYYGQSFYLKDGDAATTTAYFPSNDGTHPSNAGHARVGLLSAYLIYGIMADIEAQDSVPAAIPTGSYKAAGAYIANNATIVKAQDIEASANVSVSGATYSENTNAYGNNVILGKRAEELAGKGTRVNNVYTHYEIASGATATFTVTNVTDAFLLFKRSADCSKKATITVTDAATGDILTTYTQDTYYSGSLTDESANLWASADRLYHGEAKEINITITAVDGAVRVAGIAASFAE